MDQENLRTQRREEVRESDARIDKGVTPGGDLASMTPGGTNASSMAGSGAGGDADRPDITGRGTTDDAVSGPDHGVAKGPGGGNLGPAARQGGG